MKINTKQSNEIDTSKEYYIRVFDRISDGNMIQWNWTAFFCSIAWLYFRKMYICGAIAISCMLLSFSYNLVNPLLLLPILSIICGCFGNKIYYEYIKNRISRGEYLSKGYLSKNYNAVILLIVTLLYCSYIAYLMFDDNTIEAVQRVSLMVLVTLWIATLTLYKIRLLELKKEIDELGSFDAKISHNNLSIMLKPLKDERSKRFAIVHDIADYLLDNSFIITVYHKKNSKN